MKNARAVRVLVIAAIVSFGLALTAAWADTATYWCQNGELFVEYTSNSGDVTVMSLGNGEWHEGNMTISCNGDRVHTEMIIQ